MAGLFPPAGCRERCCRGHPCAHMCSGLADLYLGVELLGWVAIICLLDFWRNCQTGFHSGCAVSQPRQQSMSFLFLLRKVFFFRFYFLNFHHSRASECEIVAHCGCHLHVFFFRFILFYLFIFREPGKGGRKRGRETSMCACLSHAPYWGPGPHPRHVP